MQKILIIEDDRLVASVCGNKLAAEGYTVKFAVDGESGIEMVRQFQPDAVILDLMLPNLSGVDLLKQVRAIPEFKQLPIIVFSNAYLPQVVQQAWKAGATKCLSKSACAPKSLPAIVRAALNPNATPAQPAPSTVAADRSHDLSSAAPRKALLSSLPKTLAALRASLQALIKAGDNQTRRERFEEIRRPVHQLVGNAAVAELLLLSTFAAAVEALVQELHDKPASLNPSSLRTLAGAIDFLGQLGASPAAPQQFPPAKILAVDDEPVSRRAVVSALERAGLKAQALDDPKTALGVLSNEKFDLVLLDIDMPGMDGYELCTKLRAVPHHQKTPVVFITGLNGFEARANSMMSGGTELIAKPFLAVELAVKALVFILAPRIGKPRPVHVLHS